MDIGIGRLVTDGVRDAVHIAVIPISAGEELLPGQKVVLLEKEAFGCRMGRKEEIGVVDPFLQDKVGKGEVFYLFLNPGSITSLRHNWTHPCIPAEKMPEELEDNRERAKVSLRDFAGSLGLSLESLLSAASNYVEWEEYLVEGGRFEGVSLPETFWEDYQVYTGIAVSEDKQGHFFSCSC